jgi:hypothetical protein
MHLRETCGPITLRAGDEIFAAILPRQHPIKEKDDGREAKIIILASLVGEGSACKS